MKVNSRPFLKRAEGVAFWVMISFCFALLAYSYIITQGINYPLLLLLITGLIISRTAWVISTWRRPLTVEVEKVERIFFWAMSLISLVLLTLEYSTTKFFNYYLFYVFIAGLFTRYMVSFFS